MFASRILLGFVLLSVAGSAAFAQQPPRPEESRWSAGIPGSKMAIETPLKRIISKESFAVPQQSSDLKASQDRAVQAGLVAWSASVESAYSRSRVTGKPVLVFQLMGRLDEEFC